MSRAVAICLLAAWISAPSGAGAAAATGDDASGDAAGGDAAGSDAAGSDAAGSDTTAGDDGDAGADSPRTGDEGGADGERAADLRRVYEDAIRDRLPEKVGGVIDMAFAIQDFGHGRGDLAELWRVVRRDPDVRAIYENLATQYTPRLDWSAYAGGVAESTRYAGTAAGLEADLTAPLCRYVGGSVDAHSFTDQQQSGLAYDGRMTGCLPLGPFSLEVGLLSQRAARVGLTAPPTSPAGRFDSLGFEGRLRAFRWLEPTWEVAAIPVDVTFARYSPAAFAELTQYSVSAAAARYVRYAAGRAGADRVIEVIPIEVSGMEDREGVTQSASVREIGFLRVRGARLSDRAYLDGWASVQNGRIVSGTGGGDAHADIARAGVDTEVHLLLDDDFRAGLRYRRRVLPDFERRLLAEDRLSATVRRRLGDHHASAAGFAALTRSVAAPPGASDLGTEPTFGARLGLGLALGGPAHLALRGEAARSFYPEPAGAVSLEPAFDVRMTAAVTAAFASYRQ